MMPVKITRKEFLRLTASASVIAGATPLVSALEAVAQAGVSLKGITWGEPYIAVTQEISKEWSAKTGNSLSWELHQGGAATVLAKISAQWPEPAVDVVAAWNPVFASMIREDWLEPIDLAKVPNLKSIPETLVMKDKQGRPMIVPISLNTAFWAYRSDIVPTPVTKLEDLLKPELRGKIAFPAPVTNTSLQIISLALERGGNEFNIDPGFEFVKELAQRGNIGRVPETEVDLINTLTTGETAVAFWGTAPWHTVAKNFEIKILNHAESPGAKGYLFVEGLAVLKGPRADTAMDFANFFVEPANNHKYNQALGVGTTNSKAEPVEAAQRYLYSPDEISKYGYVADFGHISEALEGWTKRWEKEIAPLL
jgi:putative spermidine/putrescine transport system substrate-binding protein